MSGDWNFRQGSHDASGGGAGADTDFALRLKQQIDSILGIRGQALLLTATTGKFGTVNASTWQFNRVAVPPTSQIGMMAWPDGVNWDPAADKGLRPVMYDGTKWDEISTVSLNKGGTGGGLTAVAGAVVWTNSTVMQLTAAGSLGQVLQSNGTGAPTWTTVALPSGTVGAGSILYADTPSHIVGLAPSPGTILYCNGSNLPQWITNVSLANGGTNATLAASNGGIFYSTGSAGAILAGTATANQMLQSGANVAPAWSTATYPATTTANQLLYSSATNVVGGLATANYATLITNAQGIPSLLSSAANGQILIAAAGGAPAWGTLTAGAGISITNAAWSITIANTGVTSVAMTVPSILAVAGSPITTTGTLAITLATQAANLVLAGPSSGVNAAPTFRALVAADVPGSTPAGLALVFSMISR